MTINAGDVAHPLSKPPGEESLAAADIQRAAGIRRHRRQHQRVIVDVVVPGLDSAIVPPIICGPER